MITDHAILAFLDSQLIAKIYPELVDFEKTNLPPYIIEQLLLVAKYFNLFYTID